MYSVEQFIELSPSEAHSEDVLSDEHQLMLNRLGFELVERQRFNDFSFSSASIGLTHAHFARLDRKVKELAQEKEELLKSSKSQAATTESVKMQIETLLKVGVAFRSCPENASSIIFLPDCVRNRQEGRRACSCSYKHTR